MCRLVFLTLWMIAMNATAETISFEGQTAGSPPRGWTCGATGKGAPRWSIEADDAGAAGTVLRQSGTAPFPWCVRKDVSLADGFVEARFKPLSGKQDQAGGVVWRWKDGDNYYVARANALENNVSLYHTTGGARKTIRYVDAPVAANRWHTIRVTFTGRRIAVALDGKTYIDVEDEHITGPGAVGVWTKADSVTSFDSFAFGPPG
jgi:hypothetical protein